MSYIEFVNKLGLKLETNNLKNYKMDRELLRSPDELGNLAKTPGALMYPSDIFARGAQAFIFFNIRNTEDNDTTPSYGSICLYMPSSVKIAYQSKWSDVSLPLEKLSQVSQTFAEAGAQLENFITAGQADLGAVGRAALNDFNSLARYAKNVFDTGVIQKTPFREYALYNVFANISPSWAAQYRKLQAKNNWSGNMGALNPFTSLVYEHQELREVQFDFELFAKSSEESENIRKIIKLFKLASHPGVVDTNTLFYDSAFAFDIYLFTPSMENMFNVKKAALTMLDVDYNAAPVPSYFKDGYPTYIKLTLRFKELSLLTRDDIYENY